MYNLIEYRDNYSDTSRNFWWFKRDESPANNADLDVTNGVFNSESFKYKATLVAKTANAAAGSSFVKKHKIVVSWKYLSNLWRSFEIICKIHLELNWIEGCILSNDGSSAEFKIITDAKLHVPIVTLSTKDNLNLTKQFGDGF